MSEVKIRKLEAWVVDAFRTQAKTAGHSLEQELRQRLTETVRQLRPALIDEIDAFRTGLRAKYGEMPHSTALIRAGRDWT